MALPGFLAKLSPRQRAALVALAITAGGAVAVLTGAPPELVLQAVNVLAGALGLAP